jgi:hypothetical protein
MLMMIQLDSGLFVICPMLTLLSAGDAASGKATMPTMLTDE